MGSYSCTSPSFQVQSYLVLICVISPLQLDSLHAPLHVNLQHHVRMRSLTAFLRYPVVQILTFTMLHHTVCQLHSPLSHPLLQFLSTTSFRERAAST